MLIDGTKPAGFWDSYVLTAKQIDALRSAGCIVVERVLSADKDTQLPGQLRLDLGSAGKRRPDQIVAARSRDALERLITALDAGTDAELGRALGYDEARIRAFYATRYAAYIGTPSLRSRWKRGAEAAGVPLPEGVD